MNLYAESSAVLAWLFSESKGAHMHRLMTGADNVVSSDLALIECDRALLRATALGHLSAAEASDLRRKLATMTSLWNLMRIGPEIVERARRPFPADTIRTLDAIHLASALAGRAAMPLLEVLSLDERIREVAQDLGFKVQPA